MLKHHVYLALNTDQPQKNFYNTLMSSSMVKPKSLFLDLELHPDFLKVSTIQLLMGFTNKAELPHTVVKCCFAFSAKALIFYITLLFGWNKTYLERSTFLLCLRDPLIGLAGLENAFIFSALYKWRVATQTFTSKSMFTDIFLLW